MDGATAGKPTLPRLLSSALLTTETVPRLQRFAYWADLHAPLADVDVDEGRRIDFEARAETWRIGAFSLVEAKSAGLRFSRTAARCRRDHLDHWVVRLSLGAQWSVAMGDGRHLVDPCTPVVMRLSQVSLTVLPAGDWRLLVVPDGSCRELSAAFSRHGVGPMRTPMAGLLTDMLAALPRRLREAPDADMGLLATALRAVVLGCLPAACAGDGARQVRERVLRVIEDHLASARLDAQRICALSGLSRSVLYRLLQDEGGVAHVVRRLRLDRIRADLADPARAHEPIAAIAEQHGMYSAASFSRAFRRAFGCSPSEARAAAMGGVPPEPRGGGRKRENHGARI